jgi:hypothetical protein
VIRPKLFSSAAKAALAGLKFSYLHNRQRANSGILYARQAAEAAWNICDILIAGADSATSLEDLDEIVMRTKDNLDEVVLLETKSFESKHSELGRWLKARRSKASSTAKRLRKHD